MNTLNQKTFSNLQEILQDPSYESTYSAIHGNRRSDESQHYSTGSYSQKNVNQNADLERSDVVAVQYLSTSVPSHENSKNHRLSEQPNLNLPAGMTYSSSEAVEYIYGSNSDGISDWQGPCKRFQGVKRAQRPPPYYVDPVHGTVRTRSSSAPHYRKEGSSINHGANHNPKPKPRVLRDSMTSFLDDDTVRSSQEHSLHGYSSVNESSDHRNQLRNDDKRSSGSLRNTDSKNSPNSYSKSVSLDNVDSTGQSVFSNTTKNTYNGNSTTNINRNKNDENQEIDREQNKSNSLYSAIMELADDNSYESHYDRIRMNSTNILPNHGSETELKNLGVLDRHYKNSKKTPRFTTSENVQSVLTGHNLHFGNMESIVNGKRSNYVNDNYNYKNNRNKNDTNNNNNKNNMNNIKKENIKKTEMSILNQLSGNLGGLRNHFQRMDISNSGVLNFSEFRSSMAQLGITASQSDLFDIFINSADDNIGKGSLNVRDTYLHDSRYTNGHGINIIKYTEKLAEKVNQGELENSLKQKECTDLEERRVMKKVLHASNKQSDPMKIFSYITQNQGCNINNNNHNYNINHINNVNKKNENRNQNININLNKNNNNINNNNANNNNNNVITSPSCMDYLSPEEFKKGISTWGTNLSDREFNFLLEKIGTSTDGKISLSELDKILNSKVDEYDNNYNINKKDNIMNINPRYSKSYQSCRTINSFAQSEYNKLLDNDIGKKNSKELYKLKGKIQENCKNLPEAFKNAILLIKNKNDRSMDLDYRNSNNLRHSSSLETKENDSAYDSRFSSRSLEDNTDSEVTTSGRHYGKERKRREEYNKMINNNELLLPINRLQDVLSDAGIQLGTDDTKRLSGLISRGVSLSSSSSVSQKGNSCLQIIETSNLPNIEKLVGVRIRTYPLSYIYTDIDTYTDMHTYIYIFIHTYLNR